MGALVSVKGMVEKPKAEDAPSNLAVIGRYILTPQVLNNLNRMQAGRRRRDSADRCHCRGDHEPDNVYGFRFRGQRYDCGSKAGFLQATVAFGLARDGTARRVLGISARHDGAAEGRAVTGDVACRRRGCWT